MARRQISSTEELEPLAVTLPLVEPDERTYIARETGHIDVYLKGSALETFRRAHAGLVETGAKLKTGKPVSSKADVIAYLFEQSDFR
jgi:hypothetical protein